MTAILSHLQIRFLPCCTAPAARHVHLRVTSSVAFFLEVGDAYVGLPSSVLQTFLWLGLAASTMPFLFFFFFFFWGGGQCNWVCFVIFNMAVMATLSVCWSALCFCCSSSSCASLAALWTYSHWPRWLISSGKWPSIARCSASCGLVVRWCLFICLVIFTHVWSLYSAPGRVFEY